MDFYSALLDVQVTPIQEETMRFAMLRHDGSNAAACLGPMDKYHQPGGAGPLIYLSLGDRLQEAELLVPGSAGGCWSLCTASAAVMAPGSSSRIPKATGWLSMPHQPADVRICRNNNGDLMVAVVVNYTASHYASGLRRVGCRYAVPAPA